MVYGNSPVANAKVSIVEGSGPTMVVKKSETSDGNGQFVFKGLPPGEYNLAAEGTSKNKLRKAPPAAVSIPTPPRTVTVSIKLQ